MKTIYTLLTIVVVLLALIDVNLGFKLMTIDKTLNEIKNAIHDGCDDGR